MDLYKIENKVITDQDFSRALLDCGVENGDTIMVHSDVSVFGKLAVAGKKDFFESIVDQLLQSVGETGNVIIPTFSYSFCEGKIFDIDEKNSTVGALTNYVIRHHKFERSLQPMFSVAVSGKDKNTLLSINKDSFGKGTIFEKFHKQKGKLVFLGAPFQACTFVHYIEQVYGVPYRYLKNFHGVIKNGDKQWEDDYTFFVRKLDMNALADLDRLENYLLEKQIMKEVKLGNSRIYCVDSEDLFAEGKKLLDKDIGFFLEQK